MSDQNQVLKALCSAGHVLVAIPETAVGIAITTWYAAGKVGRFLVHSDNCPACSLAAVPGSWDCDTVPPGGGEYAGQLVHTGETEEVA